MVGGLLREVVCGVEMVEGGQVHAAMEVRVIGIVVLLVEPVTVLVGDPARDVELVPNATVEVETGHSHPAVAVVVG